MSNWRERIKEKNKQKEEEEKNKKTEEKSSTSDKKSWRDSISQKKAISQIDFDTFSDDLNTMNTTLSGIYGGWQNKDTMASRRAEVEGMYNRLLNYEDYRTNYGNDSFTDLSELANSYKSALDDWDELAEIYGQYENADAYSSAVKKAKEKAEADAAYNKRVREANLLEENSELAYWESILRTAKTKKAEADSKEDDYISDIDAGDYNDTSRSRGRAGASRRNNKEFRNYMDSIGYSSIDDLEKAISEKRDFVKQASFVQNGVQMASVADSKSGNYDKDFEAKSKYDPSKIKNTGRWSGIYDIYEYINSDESGKLDILGSANDSASASVGFYDNMDASQISLFNYWLGVSEEKAQEYLDYIAMDLESEWSSDRLKKVETFATDNPVLSSVYSVGSNVIGAPAEYIKDQAFYNKTGMMSQNVNAQEGATIRGTVSENTDIMLGNWDAFDFAYNTTMSGVDSLAAATLYGKAGGVALGLSAAASATNDALDRGLSNRQAAMQGYMSGAFEMLFEAISIGKFLDEDVSKGMLKNLASSMFVNATEEMATELANIAYDTYANGDLSNYAVRVQELVDSGMSEEEAKSKVKWELRGQVAEAGLSGALMGGGFTALNTGNYKVGEYFNNKNLGKSIRANESIGNVFDMASLSPEESSAYKAYTEYAGKKKAVTADTASDVQVGRLAVNLEADALAVLADENSTEAEKTKAKQRLSDLEAYEQNTSVSRFGKGKVKELFGNKEKVQTLIDDALKRGEGTEAYKLASEYKAKIESGKELSEKELTKLVDVTTSEVKDTVRVDAEQKLRELGETENAVELSKIISKAATGQMLSSSEMEAIANNENARKVFAEMDKSSNIELMEASEAYEGGDAELFLENYEGGDIDKYRASFDFVSSLAKNNYDADFILEHRGALTPRQVQNIYSKVVAEPRAEQQRKLDELVKNHEGQLVRKANIDDSVFNGAKGQKLWRNLNSRQKKAITFVKAFAKGAGINLKITYDGKYKGKAYNGYYDHATNTIVIDARAGFDKRYISEDAIIPTMSHELTHWMKQKSPELYAKLSKQIFDVFKAKGYTEYDLIATEKQKHPDMSDEDARDEIIARASEDLFKMSEEGKKIFDSLSESEKKTLTEKIKKIIRNLIDWANELLGLYESKSDEAGWLREFQDELSEIAKTWDQMLAKAVEVNAAVEGEGVFGNLENGISEDGTTIVGEGVLQMSEKTYYDGGRDYLAKWLKRQKGLTQEDKDDILRQTDKVAEIMRAVAEGNELPDYSRWANLEVVKDEKGEKVLSVIVKNGDYTMNIDFSQVCKKRVALNAVLNAMVQAGDLNVHVLTETDVADLNAIIKKHDFEIACALCFVDSKRYRVGAWAESFCEGTDTDDGTHKYGFNEMVRSLVPKGSKINIDEFNFTKRDIKNQPTKNLLSEASDSELDFSLIDKIMSENDVRSAQHRYARAIKENPQIRKILNSAEIISSIGLDAIRLEAPALYNIINGHQGTAKPKFSHDAVAYGNDVLKARGFTAKRAKMVGGVRCQSFSDFMANMVVDYAQFISELAAKRLTSHAYTKEPLFVKLFGLTGMKINMSLVPKAVDMTAEQQKQFAILKDKNADKNSEEYKAALEEYEKLAENAGLDENGNYIWEDETFPYDIAMEIVDDPRYSANCGTIAVGISKAHILKLLADDKISMVIPYHKSGLNRDVAMMRDIALYHDYTSVQNTRYANDEAMYGDDAGKKLNKDKGDRDFDFYGDLYGVGKKEGTHDPKKTAQNYLDWCDKHNYTPRFDEFREHPNYYKLLVDFRVYDTDGTYREQQAVKAIYPEEAEFKDLILNGVKDKDGKVYGGLIQSQENSDRLKAETKQIVDEYREVLAEKYGQDVLGVQLSEKVTGTSAYDIMGEKKALEKRYNKLAADFANYKERVKLDKTLTKGKVIDPKQLEAVARYLVKFADSDYKASELAKMLNDLYVDIQDGAMDDSMSGDEMYSKAYEVAKEIRSEAKIKIERPAYYDMILKDIRSARIAPNDGQKGDAKHRFGDNYIGKFRGRVTIANDGTPLDIKWSEWAAEYPSVFDKDIGDAQQLVELYDIYDDLRNAGDVVQEYEESEVLQSLATEIINKAWTVTKFESTADKQNKRIQELNAEHRKAMEELRESYEAKATATNNELELYQKLYGDMWSKRRKAYAKAKELGRKKLARYKENAERKSVIQTITANSLKLNKMLSDNNKDSHVPDTLKGAVKELLEAIDASSKRLLKKGVPTQRDISLNKAFSKLNNVVADGSQELGDILEDIYGSGLDESLKEFVKEIDNGTVFFLNEMSIEDLKKLDKIVKIIRTTVNKVNMYHTVLSGLSARQHGIDTIKDLDKRTKVYADDKHHFDKLKTKMYWNNLNPYYAFKNLGGSAQEIFTAFQDAQDKLAFLAKEVIDFADGLYTGKEYKRWSETYFEFAIPQPSGKIIKFSMNVPQIMSLYCVIKQEDARKHILHGDENGEGGGITIAETKDKRAVRKNIRVTESDIENILSKLDDKRVGKAKGGTARNVADKLQDYMGTRGAELGNEITMARWGIKSFGIENYFPIKVSEGAVPQKGDAPGDVSMSMLQLLNASFTHSRNHMSKKSVEIGDVFDVFSSHMSNMVRYNSFALPILDMYKWVNYKGTTDAGEEYSLQTSVKDAFGDYAWGYLQTFLKDVSGASKSDTRDNLAIKFFKNSKIAKVAGNMRVALLQFTSFIRAGAVMDNKYLLHALHHIPKIKRSEEKSGIVLWKSLGYYDTDITRGLTDKIKHDTNAVGWLVDTSLKGAELADKVTMGVLWNACELEIRDTRKDLKVGSPEFNEAVALRLREVIYKTQVVDSMLTRSQMMRSPSGWDKMLTTFASESTLSLNLMTDIFVSTQLEARETNLKEAMRKNGKYVRKAITAYVMTNIVTTVLQSLFDAFRDYDEDDKDEKYWAKLMLENFAVNSSMFAKIPYINLFVSTLQGFTASRADTDWMNSTVKTGKEIYKLMTGSGDPEKLLKYLLKAGSDVTGIAAYNVYRDIMAFYMFLAGNS